MPYRSPCRPARGETGATGASAWRDPRSAELPTNEPCLGHAPGRASCVPAGDPRPNAPLTGIERTSFPAMGTDFRSAAVRLRSQDQRDGPFVRSPEDLRSERLAASMREQDPEELSEIVHGLPVEREDQVADRHAAFVARAPRIDRHDEERAIGTRGGALRVAEPGRLESESEVGAFASSATARGFDGAAHGLDRNGRAALDEARRIDPQDLSVVPDQRTAPEAGRQTAVDVDVAIDRNTVMGLPRSAEAADQAEGRAQGA